MWPAAGWRSPAISQAVVSRTLTPKTVNPESVDALAEESTRSSRGNTARAKFSISNEVSRLSIGTKLAPKCHAARTSAKNSSLLPYRTKIRSPWPRPSLCKRCMRAKTRPTISRLLQARPLRGSTSRPGAKSINMRCPERKHDLPILSNDLVSRQDWCAPRHGRYDRDLAAPHELAHRVAAAWVPEIRAL